MYSSFPVLWNPLSTLISSSFIQLLIGIIPTNLTTIIVEVQLLISTFIVPSIEVPYGLILLQSRSNLSNTQNLDLFNPDECILLHLQFQYS